MNVINNYGCRGRRELHLAGCHIVMGMRRFRCGRRQQTPVFEQLNMQLAISQICWPHRHPLAPWEPSDPSRPVETVHTQHDGYSLR
jgi:hypothetical protein